MQCHCHSPPRYNYIIDFTTHPVHKMLIVSLSHIPACIAFYRHDVMTCVHHFYEFFTSFVLYFCPSLFPLSLSLFLPLSSFLWSFPLYFSSSTSMSVHTDAHFEPLPYHDTIYYCHRYIGSNESFVLLLFHQLLVATSRVKKLK